jgi:hypothetical protein
MSYTVDPRYDPTLGAEICDALGIDRKGRTHGKFMTSHLDHGFKTPCYSINLDLNTANCFSCRAGGTLTGLYWDAFGRSAYADFDRGQYDPDNPFRNRREEIKFDFDEPPTVNFAFDGDVVPAKSHPLGKKFLESRGLTATEADEARMQYCLRGFTYLRTDHADRIYFTDRMIIPIYEAGRLISIEGRDHRGEEHWRRRMTEAGKNPDDHQFRKVLFPRGSSMDSLWRIDKLDRARTIYVTEGILDAISLATCDAIRWNVTALGHAIPTQRQAYLLKKFDDVVYVPDWDRAGFKSLQFFKKEGLGKVRALFIPREDGVKDVSDIQQGRSKRFGSVSDLVKMRWLGKAQALSTLDVDAMGVDFLLPGDVA